jgi:hypothetical protein
MRLFFDTRNGRIMTKISSAVSALLSAFSAKEDD